MTDGPPEPEDRRLEVARGDAPPSGVPPEPADAPWQRLDARMLLVGPLESLKQFAIPLVIALLGVSGSRGGFQPWLVGPAIAIPVLIGLVPWLTTRFRMTATQFQLRKGLLNRKQLTAPLDRVRSVDLESGLFHRLLGLAKVQVGTGVDDTRIELNALSQGQAEELRRHLLARRQDADWSQTADFGADLLRNSSKTRGRGAPEPPQVLARIDWSWLRFAPFSLSRLAIVAGAVGALSQFGDSLPFLDEDHLGSAVRWLRSFELVLVVLGVAAGAVVGWVAVSVIGYVVQWWNLALTREQHALHLRSGLITRRSVTVEEAKVRGVQLTEPVLLRLVQGAELATLATGVGSGGTTTVLPPCPREVCRAVGHAVLRSEGPLVDPLRPHGPAARVRRHVRAQWFSLAALAVSVGLVVGAGAPPWLPAPVLLTVPLAAGYAELAYRNLGHRLDQRHLIAGAPTAGVRRTVLERDGVIGWVIAQSWFQRRRGLATLTATTAAGTERVMVADLPLPWAVALAAEVTPEAVAPFLAAPKAGALAH